jgi:predicted kinase
VPVNLKALQAEANISNAHWKRFQNDIQDLIAGIPSPKSLLSEITVKLDPAHIPHVLVLVGLPGSGKSTLAKMLVERGWARVNQDEMGTRKSCEISMEKSLKAKKRVVVDRCNFDIPQRHTWVKLASKYGMNYIDCVILDIPADVCKKRLETRTDHPTIKDAVTGAQVIDKFKFMMKPALPSEGFKNIWNIASETEVAPFVEKFSLLNGKTK